MSSPKPEASSTPSTTQAKRRLSSSKDTAPHSASDDNSKPFMCPRTHRWITFSDAGYSALQTAKEAFSTGEQAISTPFTAKSTSSYSTPYTGHTTSTFVTPNTQYTPSSYTQQSPTVAKPACDLPNFYPTQHTVAVAAWQHRFADQLQAAGENPATIEHAKDMIKDELCAAGALLSLSRSVNPDPACMDEELARPKLWGQKTINMAIEMTAEKLKKEGGRGGLVKEDGGDEVFRQM